MWHRAIKQTWVHSFSEITCWGTLWFWAAHHHLFWDQHQGVKPDPSQKIWPLTSRQHLPKAPAPALKSALSERHWHHVARPPVINLQHLQQDHPVLQPVGQKRHSIQIRGNLRLPLGHHPGRTSRLHPRRGYGILKLLLEVVYDFGWIDKLEYANSITFASWQGKTYLYVKWTCWIICGEG